MRKFIYLAIASIFFIALLAEINIQTNKPVLAINYAEQLSISHHQDQPIPTPFDAWEKTVTFLEKNLQSDLD